MISKHKFKLFIMLLLSLSFINTKKVFASVYKAYTSSINSQVGVNVRLSPISTSKYLGITLTKDTTITYTENDIYESEDEANDACETKTWIYLEKHKGYICSTYIDIIKEEEINDYSDSEMANLTDEEFDKYLDSENFPESYKEALKELHKKYPSWIFKSVLTNRDWNQTLNEESKIGYSTIELSYDRIKQGYEGYLNTDAYYNWATDWFDSYDGWFHLANKEIVGYYLDPRNFLNEYNIFMFEGLYYNEAFQFEEQVDKVLKTDEYTKWLFEAGEQYNVSPTFLAIRIKQEGTLNNRVTNGTTSVTCNGGTYSPNGTTIYQAPIYNFYNIGAYSSATNADLNGLCYAAIRGWNTKEIAIKQGARFISLNYVGSGKYTLYFQKYNTSSPTTDLSMQYMTNIEAPYSESYITYNTYKDSYMLNSPFVFYIPVYDDMPEEKATKPKLGNPNNWLTSLTVNGTSVSLFSGDKTEYEITIPQNTSALTIEATTVAKTSYVAIDNMEKKLKTTAKEIAIDENTKEIKIIVTSANENDKVYTIKINIEETTGDELSIEEIIESINLNLDDNYISGFSLGIGSESLSKEIINNNKYITVQITDKNDNPKLTGPIATGDKITLSTTNESKTYTVIIYGDINGDGEISINDILKLQKHLWNDTILKGAYEKAADTDKDGLIKINDILKLQKHLWNDTNISQS